MTTPKQHLFLTISILLLNALFILFFTGGFLPFNAILFFGVFLLVLVVAFKNLYWIFWVFVATLPLESTIISPELLPISLRPFQIFGIALIFGILIHWKKNELKLFWLDYLVLALPVLGFLAAINAPEKSIALKQTLILVSFVVFYLATRWVIRGKYKETIWYFLVGSLPVFVFGIYQAAAKRIGWEHFEIFDGRINSTFTEPNWLGMYTLFCISLILFLLSRSGFNYPLVKNIRICRWPVPRVISWLTYGYFSLAFMVLFLTVSRSVWLGLGVVFVIWLFLAKEKVKNFFVIIVLAMVVIGLISVFGLSTFHYANRAASSVVGKQIITISCSPSSKIGSEITEMEELINFNCRHIDLEEIKQEKAKGMEVKEILRPDPNVGIRKNVYVAVWQGIKEKPLLGHGLGSSALILGTDSHGSAMNSANLFLETWFSLGVFGVTTLVLLFIYPVFWALNSPKKRSMKANFILLSVPALLVPNLFNSGLFLGFFWVWLATISAIVFESKKC